MGNYFKTRESCPGCKSTDYQIIYARGFLESPIREYLESFYADQGGIDFKYMENARYVLGECNECGIIFQKEIPNDDLIKHLYEGGTDPQVDHKQFIQRVNLDYCCGYAKEIMMLIAFFNELPGNLKFFDFGMGWGKWCMMAQAFGCDCHGTDISSARVAIAQSHGIKVLAWEEIPEHRFDFINADQVFEHIPEPLETLKYLKLSLAKQGLIKICVPDGRDIKKRLKIADWGAPKWTKNSLNAVAPLEHINCFNRSSIIKMADSAGLKSASIPMTIQLFYSTNWKPLKPALKNILLPIYRNILERGTYLLFQNG